MQYIAIAAIPHILSSTYPKVINEYNIEIYLINECLKMKCSVTDGMKAIYNRSYIKDSLMHYQLCFRKNLIFSKYSKHILITRHRFQHLAKLFNILLDISLNILQLSRYESFFYIYDFFYLDA